MLGEQPMTSSYRSQPTPDPRTSDCSRSASPGNLRDDDRKKSAFKGRLLEAARPRAIDFRPRLAHAIDTVTTLRDAGCANVFAEISWRVDAWMSRYFEGGAPQARPHV